MNTTNITFPDPPNTLPFPLLFFISLNFLLVLLTLFGNVLTILALTVSKKLSALLSNQFIFSLAVSDILVGLTIPYHNLFYLDHEIEKVENLCVFRFVLICFVCSSSISNLLGTATDRYVAVMYPLHYSKYMTKRVAISIICLGWVSSFSVAVVLVKWNRYRENGTGRCTFVDVVPDEYFTFIILPMFGLIWIAMLVLYAKIWKEASVHAKRMKSSLGNVAPNDSKSIQVIFMILGCFSICWLPFFTIVIIMKVQKSFFMNTVYEVAFTLAMANSCMNPIIYAWKNRNFRNAFWCMLRCKSPNKTNKSFVTNYDPGTKPTNNNGSASNLRCLNYSNVQNTDQIETKSRYNRKSNDTNSSVETVCTSV